MRQKPMAQYDDDIDILWRIQGLAWQVSGEFGDEFSDVFHDFYRGKSMQVTRISIASDRRQLQDLAMLCDALQPSNPDEEQS